MIKLRVAIQQRVIPIYRTPFLETLAAHPNLELAVFAGEARPQEMITTADTILGAKYEKIKNFHFLNGPFYLCYQHNLLTQVKSFDPQVLIVEANPRYPATHAVIHWAEKHQRAVIGWGLGVPRHAGKFAALRNRQRQNFLNKFNAIIAYSRQGAAQYSQVGIDPQKIFVAANATAMRSTSPPPHRTPFSAERPANLLYVGRLQPRKKLDSLIQVCAKLPQNLQPNLWIVGDGSILADLQELAAALYPKTRFWGALYGDDLAAIYRQADLFVLPGTGGLAVQQAMSYALPVIVAEGDGTQSDLLTARNGWSIPKDDPIELYNTILSALQNPPLTQSMGKEAYLTVRDQVNVEKMVEIFVKAIQSVWKEPSI
ncbi:MAG: hypothetical protein CVU39_04720 [Chloroflexi bacterium HGW-Chloroflexi-10]|nr:MAG: hypothetical protein CVU39_04720 [Chloroflexi bacterium HGW-Chloroflexi-10]